MILFACDAAQLYWMPAEATNAISSNSEFPTFLTENSITFYTLVISRELILTPVSPPLVSTVFSIQPSNTQLVSIEANWVREQQKKSQNFFYCILPQAVRIKHDIFPLKEQYHFTSGTVCLQQALIAPLLHFKIEQHYGTNGRIARNFVQVLMVLYMGQMSTTSWSLGN